MYEEKSFEVLQADKIRQIIKDLAEKCACEVAMYVLVRKYYKQFFMEKKS